MARFQIRIIYICNTMLKVFVKLFPKKFVGLGEAQGLNVLKN